MKPILRSGIAAVSMILASCAPDPGPIQTGESERKDPDAGDVINDGHHGRARQPYEDRPAKRRYGQFN